MAYALSLFERIDSDTPVTASSAIPDVSEQTALVSRHLEKLFNTHEGDAMVSPRYGLPDFNDVASRHIDVVKNIRREIRERVEQYEPRLSQIRVMHRANPDHPLNLEFSIHAQLAIGDGTHNAQFSMAFDSSGNIKVSN